MQHRKWIAAVGLAALLCGGPAPGADSARVPNGNPAGQREPGKGAGKSGAALPDWQPHGCTVTVKDGLLGVAANGHTPFISLPLDKLDAPATLRFRLKCEGGRGQTVWTDDLAAKPDKSPKTGLFMVKAGDWAEIKAEIHAPKQRPGFVVLHLPVPAEIDWIELTADGQTRRWEF